MTALLSETSAAQRANWARSIGAAGVLCELHGRPFHASGFQPFHADTAGLAGVVAALRQLGLAAKAESCSAFALGSLTLPVLALMETGECMLVLKADEHGVLLCATHRPELVSMPMEQFLYQYAGQVVRIATAEAPAAVRHLRFSGLMHRWLRLGLA